MNKLNEKQFNIAISLLKNNKGKSLNAAKRHLVDGIEPVEAAKEQDISRQAVNSSINRVLNSYIFALQIRDAFKDELSTEDKFEIAKMLINPHYLSASMQAARLVMVNGLSYHEASKLKKIAVSSIYSTIDRLIRYYDRALEIKNEIDSILMEDIDS